MQGHLITFSMLISDRNTFVVFQDIEQICFQQKTNTRIKCLIEIYFEKQFNLTESTEQSELLYFCIQFRVYIDFLFTSDKKIFFWFSGNVKFYLSKLKQNKYSVILFFTSRVLYTSMFFFFLNRYILLNLFIVSF